MVDNQLGPWRPAPKSTYRDTSVRSELVNTQSYNTPRRKPPSKGTRRSTRTLVDAPRREMRHHTRHAANRKSIRISTVHQYPVQSLNLYGALLIPCASLLTVSRTINFLFKVLFIFPSRYLFAIGLVPIFSFRRSLPPILG